VEGKEGWEALVRCQIKRNESGRRREAGASPRSKRRGEMGGGGFSSAWSHGKKKRGGGVRQVQCGGEGWGSGASTAHTRGRRVAVGTALSLEPETGEVCREADGWARGHYTGQRRFYSDSNRVQTNSNSIQFVLNFD
jgi:hypothetical protein